MLFYTCVIDVKKMIPNIRYFSEEKISNLGNYNRSFSFHSKVTEETIQRRKKEKKQRKKLSKYFHLSHLFF